jgi:tetratricopeptide (TPR) repeat protein
MPWKQWVRKKQIWLPAAVLACVAAIAGVWYFSKSRIIKVWVYTDYAFRYSHSEWPGTIEARFQEVNRIYRSNGTGVLWKVVDSSQVDPTATLPGIDNRRANMALHLDRPTDVFVILTGVEQGSRTGSVSPFTRVAVVVDHPDKSESINARLLARELAHFFGVSHDPEAPESDKFSQPTVALIRRMRNYPFNRGIDALADSAWDKAALTAVSQDDPAPHSNPMAHAHAVLGAAFLNERKIEAGLVHFRAAVQVDPHNKVMRLNLAEALTRDRQYDKALEQAREAVRIASDDPLAHRALAALLGRNRQPEAALQEVQAAIRLEPNNPQNQVLLGYEYAAMFGHLDDAVAALQEATREAPDSPMARNGLEQAQTLKMRVEAEIDKQRAVLHDKPNDPDAHYRLAKAEARAGDLKNAIADMRRACELRPDSAATHTELAELYLVSGDTATAWEEIRKVRALGTEPPSSLLARLPAQK